MFISILPIYFTLFSCVFFSFLDRWSRLLLGREFSFSSTHLLRIWDCLFYAAGEAEGGCEGEGEGKREQGGVIVAVDLREGDKTVTAAIDIPSHNSNSILGGHGRKKESPVTDSYPPMMKALREFMLAMLVHVSESAALSLLSCSLCVAISTSCSQAPIA